MIRFDRRRWLRSLCLAIGGVGVSRLLHAEAQSPSAVPGSADHLVRLSLNENPYGPSPAAVAALQREFSNLCRYTGAEYDGLVGVIAAREGVAQEQIILGEILEPLGTHLSLQGGPGGEFVYSDPGYTALIDSAAAVGGIGVPIPLNRNMQNDLSAIAAKVNGRTRAVFLVNPHNPTGTVMDSDQLRRFVRDSSKRALVIVDEAYLEFSERYAERTLSDLVREGENMIVFRTFAKIYGLAGMDIGYGLVPKSISQMLTKQGLDNPHLFNRVAIAAAAASLQDAGYVATVAAKVAQERELWFTLFRELNVHFTESNGNFVFYETGMPH